MEDMIAGRKNFRSASNEGPTRRDVSKSIGGKSPQEIDIKKRGYTWGRKKTSTT